MTGNLQYLPQTEGHISPFGRAVDRMHVSAEADQGRLRAELTGWYQVRVVVSEASTHQADADLERALERLARQLFVARTREYYRLMEVHLQPDPTTLRRMRDNLEDATEHAHVSGTAAGGAVEVSSIGMRHFAVRLRPGTAAQLGGDGLGAALTVAANDMVGGWLQVLADYKRERWTR
ncbi:MULTISPECIES: hypothetical protein [unclassified Nocardioides]|jgi:hypothetical protein|uniref:hypothetical protein n=1 Tax=unclassified Nocardioides TaxID=2615069 RepID=UPI00114E8EDF|nr:MULTISPECIES: hypothetical protein [unclassified Nocardioides]TQK72600.1 hypothetical protein FBY23_4417 [Nocardioides sp. SLBN-35]WGY03195.1 hypothetical protein QI633_05415 [Nocardioides sp. QY071]